MRMCVCASVCVCVCACARACPRVEELAHLQKGAPYSLGLLLLRSPVVSYKRVFEEGAGLVKALEVTQPHNESHIVLR